MSGDSSAFHRGLRRDRRHPWRHHNLGRLLLLALDRWQNELVRALRDAGFADLKATHVNLLRHVDMEGTRITEIGERAGVTKQAVGKLIVACEKLDLVHVVADPTDGRAKIVRFTPKGRAIILAEKEIIDRIDGGIKARLGAGAFAQLRANLILLGETD